MSSHKPTDAYAIGTATPEEESAVRDLLRSMIGETIATRWTAEFYRWKHRESPFGPSYAAVAAPRDDPQPVSVHHAMDWAFLTPDGTRVPAARPCDGATYPDHQRRGLYAALDRRTQEDLRGRGARLCIGTPNPKTLGMELKTGWSVAARLRCYARPVYRPASLLAVIRRGTAPEPERLPAGLMSWPGFLGRFGEERVADLVVAHEARRRRVGYRTPRDLRYLQWRYGAIPTVRYGIAVLQERGALQGFAVVRPTRGLRSLPVLVLTELFLAEPAPGLAVRLLKELRRPLPAGYLLAHFAPGTVEHRALRAAGFLPVPGRATVLTARELLPVPLDPTQESSWDLTLGELEVF